MSQHDLNIANQTAANARADINNALQALGSNSSGSTAPSTTFANMHWYDTSANILKQRSEANDAWISIGYFDQSANSFRILDDTQVVNTSGTQTGLLGDQATSAWQAGTGTTESLVSPAKVKSAILSLAPSPIKAFVNFDGTNATIRKQSNIASVVRTGVGVYTLTFTTAMSDANYIIHGTTRGVGSTHPAIAVSISYATAPTTTSFEIVVAESGGANSVGRFRDTDIVNITVIS